MAYPLREIEDYRRGLRPRWEVLRQALGTRLPAGLGSVGSDPARDPTCPSPHGVGTVPGKGNPQDENSARYWSWALGCARSRCLPVECFSGGIPEFRRKEDESPLSPVSQSLEFQPKQERHEVFAPLCDMLNHDPWRSNTALYLNTDTGSVVIRTTDRIPKGRQLLIDYDMANTQLLPRYGFAVVNGPPGPTMLPLGGISRIDDSA